MSASCCQLAQCTQFGWQHIFYFILFHLKPVNFWCSTNECRYKPNSMTSSNWICALYSFDKYWLWFCCYNKFWWAPPWNRFLKWWDARVQKPKCLILLHSLDHFQSSSHVLTWFSILNSTDSLWQENFHSKKDSRLRLHIANQQKEKKTKTIHCQFYKVYASNRKFIELMGNQKKR